MTLKLNNVQSNFVELDYTNQVDGANHNILFPQQSGTLALMSDLPVVPSGQVLQVRYAETTTETTHSGATWGDIDGCTTSITVQSATSIIYLFSQVTIRSYGATNAVGCGLQLVRNINNDAATDTSLFRDNLSANRPYTALFQSGWYPNAATSSAVRVPVIVQDDHDQEVGTVLNYGMQAMSYNSYVVVNPGGDQVTSNILLMEIAT